MDSCTEIGFVRKCIKKEYHERLLFELQSKKHRAKALSRLAHISEDVLRDGYLNLSALEFQKQFAPKMSSTEKCYLISDSDHDGETMLLAEAILFCQTSYMLVVLIAGDFVVIKPEIEKKSTFYVFLS